ncbi:alpha/beta hydrolase [Rhizobium calliandrae]|uniref:Alpha/beta hydrolase n=1 Tax=Rhizobium calliandrae TaxID=1312182 RepID=A0ABT7KPP1_9HYPH|nr:alpha/beta hydrolase [Rhizobium calliandrae]MDL2410601.1 alpha/beta hydrolase [Rhizobium calliandrae]
MPIGTRRVAKTVLIGAVPPIMVKTQANPDGLPIEVFDGLRNSLISDRSQFYRDFAKPFYGVNFDGSAVTQATLDQFWLLSIQAGLINAFECIKAFSETDYTADLKRFDVPTLFIHREDDQIVPIRDSARKAAPLVRGAKEIYYPGAPNGLTVTHRDRIIRTFLRSSRHKSEPARGGVRCLPLCSKRLPPG